MRMILSLVLLFLVSCGGQKTLEVQQFHLRATEAGEVGEIDDMVRGEMNKRLYGAVTAEERRERQGQYYDVSWSQLTGDEAVTVRFEYRQAATGSKILRQERRFQPSADGAVSFAVTGRNYQENGRVTSWQVTLLEGGVVKATERSYLWR